MFSEREGRGGSNKSHLCEAGLRKHRRIMDNGRTKPIVAFPNAFYSVSWPISPSTSTY